MEGVQLFLEGPSVFFVNKQDMDYLRIMTFLKILFRIDFFCGNIMNVDLNIDLSLGFPQIYNTIDTQVIV